MAGGTRQGDCVVSGRTIEAVVSRGSTSKNQKTGIKPGDPELACTHDTPGEVAPRTSAKWVLGARIEEWSMDRGWGSIQHIS